MDFLVLKKCHKPLPLPPFKPSTGIGSKPKISNLLLNIILLLKNLNNFEFRFANRLVGFDSSRMIPYPEYNVLVKSKWLVEKCWSGKLEHVRFV